MASLKHLKKSELTTDSIVPSSSPAFATPLTVLPAQRTVAVPPPIFKSQPVLSIILPPTTLRPLAFRTFTKKYNLTLSTTALSSLATFIGKHCGARWKDDGLAEGVLEEVAKLWKKQSTEPIVKGEEDVFRNILKTVESCMSGGKVVSSKALSRQSSFALGNPQLGSRPALDHQQSFGLSHLELDQNDDEDEDALKDPREWVKFVDAFDQPRMIYNTSKKHFEKSKNKSSIFPPPSHKTEFFRQRYHIVHQRILRNEGFDQQPLAGTSRSNKNSAGSSANKITPIANLLGRHKSPHLLLGLLAVLPTGVLAISDLSGSIPLDLQHARPYPDAESVWFAPGMIVLVDGIYIEDGTGDSALGAMGGIGATIAGKFVVSILAHPPPERRNTSLGISNDNTISSSNLGPAFGWTDFLGVGSEKATGSRMRRLQSRILGPGANHQDSRKIAIASNIYLDSPRHLTALRSLFSHYAVQPANMTPLAFILCGPFASQPALASNSGSGSTSGGSLAYKEGFNSLAATLSDFPTVLARTSLIFVSADGDAWASAHGAGQSVPLPRKGVPSIFTTRIAKVVAEANREVRGKNGSKSGMSGKEGDVVWASNPARVSWFGSVGEMVVFRDDISGRLRRGAIRFPKLQEEGECEGEGVVAESSHQENNNESATENVDVMDIDESEKAMNNEKERQNEEGLLDADLQAARRLVKTLLDQAHLSPFPISSRPVHWDYGSSLSMFPLPTCLVIADPEAPTFALNYSGCCVMNPGSICETGGRSKSDSRWIEYDILDNKGSVMTGR